MQTNDDQLMKFERDGVIPLPTPEHSSYLEHDSANLWYADYGSGPVVILLHGGLGNAGNWGYQVPALLENGYRVLVMDSRGHGRSTRDEQPFAYTRMAGDVLALMDQREIPNAAFVGWSDGAVVAMSIAMQAPERVAGVFFFGCNVDPSGTKEITQATPILARCLGRHAQEYAKLSTTPDEFEAFSAAVGTMMETQPNYTAEDLAALQVPFTIVHSENDEFIKREHAVYLAETIPEAQLIDLHEVSHFAPWQRPTYFNQAMLGFLEDVY